MKGSNWSGRAQWSNWSGRTQWSNWSGSSLLLRDRIQGLLTNHGSIKMADTFIMAGVTFGKQVTHGIQISTLERELVCGITKETLPYFRIEIRELIRMIGLLLSSKPIIKDHMERGSDSTRVSVQDKRDHAGMLGRQAHVN
jgi:hypothetical protein